jgi:hypothetical protein
MLRFLVGVRARGVVVGVVLLLGVVAVGCGSDEGGGPGAGGDGPRVLRVGSDYDTIQAAVDDADPGDLVLIAPGTYRESVAVDTERLVIRGEDRNAVVVDGGDELLHGFSVTADQVAVENLTIRRFAINGLIFTGSYDDQDPQNGPVGWRASYVTAVNNGLYGLYAFGTGPGVFDHNYASGHPSSGIYVGQCEDCGAVVRDNVVERNAIGLENTNASGVVIARNIVRGNRVGITVNSGTGEKLAPERASSVVANLVEDNDDPATPATEGAFGVGIAVAGGQENTVARNVVRGHPFAGVVLIDQEGFAPTDNTVVDNDLADNDLAIVIAAEDGGAPTIGATCVEGNGAGETRPADLEALLGCDRADEKVDLGPSPLDQPPAPEGRDHTTVEEPGDQPEMPDGGDAAWEAPAREPEDVDLDAFEPPAG